MSKEQLRYYFNHIERCNMCGSDAEGHKVLGKRLNKSQGKNPKKKTGITTTVVQCRNCGLIYANPQPVPFSIQDHYGVPPEEYWVNMDFSIGNNYFQGEIRTIKRLIPFKEGMKSLDVGTGLGKAMNVMSKAGFDVYGFEPSEPFYKKAISLSGISPDRIKLGMIENMDYPQNHFDFITFGAVLEHLYNPSDALIKALGWLKPQGVIHIEVPSKDWLIHKIINRFYRLTGSDYVANISPMHEPYHLYEFGLESFREHAKHHNYEITFYEYYVCKTHLPRIADLLLKRYMKWTNTGQQLCVWLRKK